MYMYIYMYIYICVYKFIYMYIYVYINVYIYMCVCIYIYIFHILYMCVCINVYVYVNIYISVYIESTLYACFLFQCEKQQNHLHLWKIALQMKLKGNTLYTQDSVWKEIHLQNHHVQYLNAENMPTPKKRRLVIFQPTPTLFRGELAKYLSVLGRAEITQRSDRINYLQTSEPRKKPSYFPLNPGWFIGILIMAYYIYFNPYITG